MNDRLPRGQGIGGWMVQTLVAHPDLQGLRRIALWTRDAAALYARSDSARTCPLRPTWSFAPDSNSFAQSRLPRHARAAPATHSEE